MKRIPPKLKYEDVYKEFEKHGYKLLEKEYKRNNIKMSFITKEGYKATMNLHNLKSGKSPQFFSKFNKYTIENIQHYLKLHNAKAVLLSTDFVDSRTPLLFQCECGSKFYMSTEAMIQRTHICCEQCVYKYRGLTRRINFDVIQKTFQENGYKLLSSESDYNGNNTYLKCEDSEGYRGYQSYAHLNSSDHKNISRFGGKTGEEFTIYNLNHYAKLHKISGRAIKFINGKWTRQGIQCRCGCGNIFETSTVSFLSGKNKCDKCANSISKIEFFAKEWLDNNNISYISQYTYADCRDKLPLPFDFYIPHLNLLVEIDGEGHYYPCYFNNCSYESALKSYKRIVKHDKIKNIYCKNNSIPLLRIPYWEFPNDNYKNILYANIIM